MQNSVRNNFLPAEGDGNKNLAIEASKKQKKNNDRKEERQNELKKVL
jgi:hypothetical protein